MTPRELLEIAEMYGAGDSDVFLAKNGRSVKVTERLVGVLIRYAGKGGSLIIATEDTWEKD